MVKDGENARKRYSQAVLSGWGSDVQPGKESSGNSSSGNKTVGDVPGKFWEQKEYILFVPVVIKQVELSDSEYKCEISIPLDVDVPVRLHRSRSQKMSQFTTYLLAEKVKDKTPTVSMVSRISGERLNSLSPVASDSLGTVLAYIYSRVLGFTDRAAKCIVYESKGQKNKVDEGVGSVGSYPQKDLGEHKGGGGGEEVRKQVRTKKAAKDSSQVADMDREVLGN